MRNPVKFLAFCSPALLGLWHWVLRGGYSLVTVTENRTKTGAHCKARILRLILSSQLFTLPRRDGGTGRRSGLKIRRTSVLGGSTPPPGTKINCCDLNWPTVPFSMWLSGCSLVKTAHCSKTVVETASFRCRRLRLQLSPSCDNWRNCWRHYIAHFTP